MKAKTETPKPTAPRKAYYANLGGFCLYVHVPRKDEEPDARIGKAFQVIESKSTLNGKVGTCIECSKTMQTLRLRFDLVQIQTWVYGDGETPKRGFVPAVADFPLSQLQNI